MDTWPLVGRGRELAQLTAALAARRGAVITGPAGVGKTTLATAGLRLAEKQGMTVARATATYASRGLPFGALASILPPDPGGDRLGREDPGQLLDAAVQAAAGRSNKQIASDMQLSVRTVESHLQRAYDKLGVSGRHELADALREQPTD